MTITVDTPFATTDLSLTSCNVAGCPCGTAHIGACTIPFPYPYDTDTILPVNEQSGSFTVPAFWFTPTPGAWKCPGCSRWKAPHVEECGCAK